MVAGSKESSGVAIHRRAVDANSLVCGSLVGGAAHVCRSNKLLLGTLAGIVLRMDDCVVASGLAGQARRPDILAGVDMASVLR